MTQRTYFKYVLFILLITTASLVIAQPGGGSGGGNGKPPCPKPTPSGPCAAQVPITGIEYLIGLGALIGLRFIRKEKKV